MVKQQRPGNLKGKVNFCMPWTSSSHSIDWEYLCSFYSLKWSWFRQNPTVEVDNIPLVTKHNTWVLRSTCLKALCKGRMHHSPCFIAGEREAQPSEERCMAEPRFTIPVLRRSVGQLSLNPNGIQDPNRISWRGPQPYAAPPSHKDQRSACLIWGCIVSSTGITE